MRGLRAHRRARPRKGHPQSESLDSPGAHRAVAHARLSRDERVDDQARAQAKDSHRGFVSRDDRRGASLADRGRAAPARGGGRGRQAQASRVRRRSLAGRARILPLARGPPLQDSRAHPARQVSPLRDVPGVLRQQAQARCAERARRRRLDRRHRQAVGE